MRDRRIWLNVITATIASLWFSGCAPSSDVGTARKVADARHGPRGDPSNPSVSEVKRTVEPPSVTAEEAKRRLDFEREKLAFERERLEVERKRLEEDAQRHKDQTTFLLAIVGGVVAVIAAVVGIALKVARREKP